ncbi:hypothetical protein C8R46DRAFT_1225991 [Mycena filopes]|nr:hypothetical protein C8R46DRAFT_1225991 [Mycena filopes]
MAEKHSRAPPKKTYVSKAGRIIVPSTRSPAKPAPKSLPPVELPDTSAESARSTSAEPEMPSSSRPKKKKGPRAASPSGLVKSKTSQRSRKDLSPDGTPPAKRARRSATTPAPIILDDDDNNEEEAAPPPLSAPGQGVGFQRARCLVLASIPPVADIPEYVVSRDLVDLAKWEIPGNLFFDTSKLSLVQDRCGLPPRIPIPKCTIAQLVDHFTPDPNRLRLPYSDPEVFGSKEWLYTPPASWARHTEGSPGKTAFHFNGFLTNLCAFLYRYPAVIFENPSPPPEDPIWLPINVKSPVVPDTTPTKYTMFQQGALETTSEIMAALAEHRELEVAHEEAEAVRIEGEVRAYQIDLKAFEQAVEDRKDLVPKLLAESNAEGERYMEFRRSSVQLLVRHIHSLGEFIRFLFTTLPSLPSCTSYVPWLLDACEKFALWEKRGKKQGNPPPTSTSSLVGAAAPPPSTAPLSGAAASPATQVPPQYSLGLGGTGALRGFHCPARRSRSPDEGASGPDVDTQDMSGDAMVVDAPPLPAAPSMIQSSQVPKKPKPPAVDAPSGSNEYDPVAWHLANDTNMGLLPMSRRDKPVATHGWTPSSLRGLVQLVKGLEHYGFLMSSMPYVITVTRGVGCEACANTVSECLRFKYGERVPTGRCARCLHMKVKCLPSKSTFNFAKTDALIPSANFEVGLVIVDQIIDTFSAAVGEDFAPCVAARALSVVKPARDPQAHPGDNTGDPRSTDPYSAYAPYCPITALTAENALAYPGSQFGDAENTPPNLIGDTGDDDAIQLTCLVEQAVNGLITGADRIGGSVAQRIRQAAGVEERHEFRRVPPHIGASSSGSYPATGDRFAAATRVGEDASVPYGGTSVLASDMGPMMTEGDEGKQSDEYTSDQSNGDYRPHRNDAASLVRNTTGMYRLLPSERVARGMHPFSSSSPPPTRASSAPTIIPSSSAATGSPAASPPTTSTPRGPPTDRSGRSTPPAPASSSFLGQNLLSLNPNVAPIRRKAAGTPSPTPLPSTSSGRVSSGSLRIPVLSDNGRYVIAPSLPPVTYLPEIPSRAGSPGDPDIDVFSEDNAGPHVELEGDVEIGAGD